MKRNKLDLAKIISDFLFIGETNPEEKAQVVFNVKHSLTAHGFEKYIQYYIKKFGYKAFLNGNTHDFDWGIDIIWEKDKWDLHIELTAQCKKYCVKDITEDQVRSFVWGIYVYDKKLLDPEHSILYYITTSKFTARAKEYAKKAWVHCVEFSDIYDMQSRYDVKEFLEDIRIHEMKKEYEKCITKEQLTLIKWVPVNIQSYEIVKFLKQIRRDITSTLEWKKLYEVATNNTLELLARHRPHNLEALKQVMKQCNTKEQRKLDTYGYIFTERLKYVWA